MLAVSNYSRASSSPSLKRRVEKRWKEEEEEEEELLS
jgi:hypothetical protein